ncbi:MAG: thioesterase domain-containing protein [Acidobacteriota bacterium]
MSDHDASTTMGVQDRLERLTPAQRALLARRLNLTPRRRSGPPLADAHKRLVAYYVAPPTETSLAAEELRRFVSGRLPAFMVPSSFVALDALPLLPNGKVDRAALSVMRRAPARTPDEPSANVLEAQLMRIWDDLIDVRDIGPDDNFFELGGHSLLVPRLMDIVQRDFGITLPLGVLFQAPTVRQLAEIIRARNPNQSWRSLVAIREGGRRPPLYMVHGLGGEIGYFYNLAGYLHPDQPVYGLQAPAEPFSELEPMATRYLEEVRAHQPHGPYMLGGYCVGGCVAYEMARQLVEAGESVRLLAIIDAATPGTKAVVPPISRRLQRWTSKTPRELVAAVKARAAATARWLAGERSDVVDVGDVPRWYGVPRPFREIATKHFQAARTWIPRPYHGDAWLFRSENDELAKDLGWRPLVQGRLEIEMLRGAHADVLKEPHLEGTARQLSAVVDAIAAADQ